MQNTFNNFRGGVKFLDLTHTRHNLSDAPTGGDPVNPLDHLGPLKELIGTWKGAPNDGWNIISIPAKGGFKFEVIPYSEELKFNSGILVGADNVGPVLNEQPTTQQLWGLMYEQIIKSSCTPIPFDPNERTLPNGAVIPPNFERVCKFGDGETIHAETGFFLNTKDFNSNLNLSRLSTIPHGNSVLQLGKSSIADEPVTDSGFIGVASPVPTALDGGKVTIKGRLGYDDVINQRFTPFPDLPKFNITDPNSALHNGLADKTILEMTTLKFSTEYDKAGILNIPFLQHNVEATKMTATFWIQKIKGEGEPDYWQLQYTQTIDLVFPIPDNPMPIIWPHITVNTLRKISDVTETK
jgi:hypothetical protein